ncbi:MAG TPA: TSUP family transporter [Candidatus Avidesulfovibrio excrementigallinarum]|nr:TSUP family transporter [Candidatus Avidesulfovibrio excrementigallinarum]
MFAMLITLSICVTASFVAGFIDSIAGGGGLITLPAMLLAGLPPHMALGTGKFAATLGTLVALLNYARNHLVNWHIAPFGVLCALIGSWSGSQLALHLDSAVLGKVLVFLLPVGMLVTFMPKEKPQIRPLVCSGVRFWLVMPLVSFGVAFYDGFFGPGAGSFFIIAFHWILYLGLVEASATAKLFNLASNVGAFIAFCVNGQVLYAVALPMACASIAGNWLGSRMAIRTGAGAVRKFLIVSLCLLMATLLYRTLG